jgi:hypothetical protein
METGLTENGFQPKETAPPAKIPIAFDHDHSWHAIEINGAQHSAALKHRAAQAARRIENRTTNSFAAAFAVAMAFLMGLVVTATGITIKSMLLAAAGCGVLFGSAGLYGFLLM